MAVEAHHPNLFSSQYITNKYEFGLLMDVNQGKANIYNTQMGSGVPLINTCPAETLPLYQPIVCDSVLAKTSMKSESGLTYNNVTMTPRKRSRESFEEFNAVYDQNKNSMPEFLAFLGQDMSLQIQQEQSYIDKIIAQHAEKIKMEINERRKRQSRILVSAIQEGLMKKLKDKEEEIERIGILNWVLQERIKSLCAENKMWRDIAQTNEETANTLRSNLERVIAHVSEQPQPHAVAEEAEDAESCCDSCDNGVEEGQEQDSGKGMCRTCGKKESCVLLLPCRHLCLCTSCGSTMHNCPICHSITTGSVHVHIS